jgi:hypothetical protein
MATSVITAGNKREHRIGTGVLAGVVVALAAFVGYSTFQNDAQVVTPEVLTPIERNAPTANSHVADLEKQFAGSYSAGEMSLQAEIDAAAASALAEQGQPAEPYSAGEMTLQEAINAAAASASAERGLEILG